MKLKLNKKFGPLFLLAVIIFTLGLVGGCVRGSVAIGWSGGTVAGNDIFIGTNAGRLASINLNDRSILRAEPLVAKSQGSFLSCASLGCGGGAATVPIYGAPAVSDNSVYIAGYNGRIYAYKADNLAQRWIFPANTYLKSFVGSPVIHGNKLFVGNSDGKLYAIDINTSSLLYEYQTGDRIWSTPAVDASSNTILFGSYDKKFYALSTDDLSLKWSYETDGSIISTPFINEGVVYFGAFDRNFYAINIADGSLKWQFRGDNWFWAKPQILNGVLFAGCLDGFVYALDPLTGASVNEPYNLGSAVASSPAVVDNFIVFASREGIVYKIDTLTMVMTEVINLDTVIDGPLTAHEDIVYIHPQSNVLKRIDVKTGAQLPDIAL